MTSFRSARTLPWLAFAALVIAAALAGVCLLFTTFMVYDDEGYILVSLRNFTAHGTLYDRVYSQYGPFFYAAAEALSSLLGFAWDHTAARWFGFFTWLSTAGVCSMLVWRACSSVAGAALTFASVFVVLAITVYEPIHPGGAIALAVALAAWLGWEAHVSGRVAAFAVITGTLGAASALMKINVGIFLLFSAAVWLALHSRHLRCARSARIIIVPLIVLLPWALMHTLWTEEWVIIFSVTFTLASLCTLLVIAPGCGRTRYGLQEWGWFAGSATLVTLATVWHIHTKGTSWHGFLAGIVLGPLKQPKAYCYAVHWLPGVLPVAIISALATISFGKHVSNKTIRQAIAWMRLTMLVILTFILIWRPYRLSAFILSYGISLAIVCLWPLRDKDMESRPFAARGWLALLLILQSLQAYPVAGDQLGWGTFLWIPLLMISVVEAFETVLPEENRRLIRPLILSVSTALSIWPLGQTAYANLASGEYLELPGAKHLFLPDNITFALRIINENARAHGDMLFSLPGTYSLNLWTGLPTPTLANTTHWFTLLTAEQQEAIASQLDAHPRAIFIVQRNILQYYIQYGYPVCGPLIDYLHNNYEQTFAVDGYSFWTRRGRSIAPLSTGAVNFDAQKQATGFDLILKPQAKPIVALEVCRLELDGRRHCATLKADNTQLWLTPLDIEGHETGPTHAIEWPVISKNICRLHARFSPNLIPNQDPGQLLVLLWDSQGRLLDGVRILR